MSIENLQVKPFYITLRRNYRNYKVAVQQTYLDNSKEQFSIIGRNKTVVIQSNRPKWYRLGVRHRQEWQHISGEIPYNTIFNELCQAVADHLKKIQKSK